MPKIIDRTGDRYGRLLVVAPAGVLKRQKAYECLCDCGKTIFVPNGYLQCGDTRSCGCLHHDVVVARSTVHGHFTAGTSSPTRNSWRAMHERCRLPSHPHWKNYGGRGVTVCESWSSFSAFLADMGERPAGMTLDRVDNEKGYSPGNCRWADRATQTANRRNARARAEEN